MMNNKKAWFPTGSWLSEEDLFVVVLMGWSDNNYINTHCVGCCVRLCRVFYIYRLWFVWAVVPHCAEQSVLQQPLSTVWSWMAARRGMYYVGGGGPNSLSTTTTTTTLIVHYKLKLKVSKIRCCPGLLEWQPCQSSGISIINFFRTFKIIYGKFALFKIIHGIYVTHVWNKYWRTSAATLFFGGHFVFQNA